MLIRFICYFIFFVLISANIPKGFDETILFDINWVGDKLDGIDTENSESILVKTSHLEEYKCFLPQITEKENNNQEKYEGPSPIELIAPLFTQTLCSYRLESYWTYEICHGKFIRQYHEDREGKKMKLQEFILGKWEEKNYLNLVAEHKNAEADKNRQIPVKKIDNVNLPYLEITMGNGTLCDLNNKSRETKVLYVCYAHGKHDIYSLKETSTCQYEIIVLSPFLCAHPKYKPKDDGEHKINCTPINGSPRRPYSLAKLALDSVKLRHKSEYESFRIEFNPVEIAEKEETLKVKETPIIDTSPVENFLAGKNCLFGGTGWWRYEFCYGKSIEQYHIEVDGTKTSINLGLFNKQKHLAWLEANPNKRPKPVEARKQLSHFYSDGDICDKTNKPRQTEVKLKCLENTANINAVSLYLLEPRYCEYILGVESPLICNILSRADENGLVTIHPLEDNEPEISVIRG